jgi:hypothetical protein
VNKTRQARCAELQTVLAKESEVEQQKLDAATALEKSSREECTRLTELLRQKQQIILQVASPSLPVIKQLTLFFLL